MMLFSSVLFLLSFLSVFAAPIPTRLRHLIRDDVSTPWPATTDLSDAKTAVSYISGNLASNDLTEYEGQPALKATYPKGSYAGSKTVGIAGFIFDAKVNKDIETALSATLTYDVFFPQGFQWAYGGKLPGFFGGDDAATAGECAGGNHNNDCWSARVMWRQDGAGELYSYVPTWNQELPVCKGECTNPFGASIGRGNFTFKDGEWNTVTETVTLNTPGASVSGDEVGDGMIEVTVNGGKVVMGGLKLREGTAGKIRGVMIHTFFGGSTQTHFASPADQEAYFRNFKVDITKTLSD